LFAEKVTFCEKLKVKGYIKAMPQLWQLVAGFPQLWPGYDPRSDHVGSIVNRVALGQVLSEYLGLPCRSSFQH
jgi:hypothetical protein